MGELALAVLAFLGSHILVASPGLRRPAEARLGRVGFALLYSALSVALLAWAVAAYRAAPVMLLWEQHDWMRWVPPVVMFPASILLAGGILTPNPFSVGPGAKGFDPARPGLLRLTRHPVLWGLGLWAGAHMVANGDLGALILFGPLFLLALVGPKLLDARRRASLGVAEWARLAGNTKWLASAILAEAGWRLAAGPVLYLLLVLLHEPVIGIAPLP